MEKKIRLQPILQRSKHVNYMVETKPFTWKEIQQMLEEEKVTLQDDDIVQIGYEEGWQEGDSAKDPSYDFKVLRPTLETDEQFERRKKRAEDAKVANEKRQYELYLELKEKYELKPH